MDLKMFKRRFTLVIALVMVVSVLVPTSAVAATAYCYAYVCTVRTPNVASPVAIRSRMTTTRRFPRTRATRHVTPRRATRVTPVTVPSNAQYIVARAFPVAVNLPAGEYAISVSGLPTGVTAPDYLDVSDDLILVVTSSARAGVFPVTVNFYDADGSVVATARVTLTLVG